MDVNSVVLQTEKAEKVEISEETKCFRISQNSYFPKKDQWAIPYRASSVHFAN